MLTSEANDSPEGGQEVIAGTQSPSNVIYGNNANKGCLWITIAIFKTCLDYSVG